MTTSLIFAMIQTVCWHALAAVSKEGKQPSNQSVAGSDVIACDGAQKNGLSRGGVPRLA